MKNFYVAQFLGYENKKDVTNQQPGVLIAGSKNVVSTDGDTVAIRQGYTEFGTESDALTPILSNFEFQKLRQGQIALRSYDDELEFYWSTQLGGDDEWHRIADGWSDVQFSFTTFFSTTEQDDQVLFVNGDNDIYMWSGGIATFASATANSITKQGTETWAESGFLTAGTRQVVIDGTTYTYTGGETTTTLTGVTPDPTSAGHTAGELIVQAVRTTSNKPASAAPFTNDIIRTFNNQIIVGSYNDQTLYISDVGDFSVYTGSSPRLPGEGTSLTLDAPPVDIVIPNDGQSDESFYVTAGNDFWYQVVFQLSSDTTKERVSVKPLKTSPGQAANNQGAVAYVKNFIGFISKEPTFDFLGRIQDVDTPQSTALSDRIKTDFDSYDFTGSHVKFYRNNIYIALPQESKLLAYNFEKGFWEPPWDLPAGRLAIIGDDLILHSNSTPSSYKLFQGYNDNGNPINAVALFSYQNMGERMKYKNFNMVNIEGYITDNTTLSTNILYDYEGYNGMAGFDTDGTESNIIFKTTDSSGTLGETSLGEHSLGGDGQENSKNKFRKFKKTVKNDFFECAFKFSSNEINQQWEIISFGADYTMSSNYPVKFIK